MASMPVTDAASFWPTTSRCIQRCKDGMTSAVVTRWPSWNFRPGRSVNRQVSPSAEVLQSRTICGLGCSLLSQANSVSYTINP